MTYEELFAKYKLKMGDLVTPTPGVGFIAATHTRMSRNQLRRLVSIHGVSNQFMYIMYIDAEYCVGVYPIEFSRLATAGEERRNSILTFMNELLNELKVPVQYGYHAQSGHILLRNKVSSSWTFRLEYTFKTPGFNNASDFIQVEAMPWQIPERASSNTLEGRFDPDQGYKEEHIAEAVKLITENLA